VAIRTNCIEYVGTNRTTTLADSTTEEQSITVDIPETSSRTFLSVFMEVYCSENNAATSSRGSMTARTLGVGIDAVADDDATVTDTVGVGADQVAFVFKRDITSYFTTNYTGTSHTVGLRFSFTQSGANALTVNNVSMRLVVTYSYDDTSESTRIKTVRIPLQSKLGACGTSEETIYSDGTNNGSGGGSSTQIPDLSTFLPEASKTYKDIFFDIEWNDGYSGTTDQVVSLRTASDTTYNPGTYEKANNTNVHHHLFWKRTDLATNAAQAFKFWATSAAHHHPVVILTVTYTYDHSSSNDQIASVMIPLRSASSQGLAYTGMSSEPLTSASEVWIEEPATVSMLHSAVIVHDSFAAQPTSYNIRVNGSSYVQYTRTVVSGNSGNSAFAHRIDSGGLGGLSLTRGKNAVVVQKYFASNNVAGEQYLLLNYTHGKPTDGSGSANHTIKRLVSGDAADSTQTGALSSQAESIPETGYWLNGYGVCVEGTYLGSTRGPLMFVVRDATDTPSSGAFSVLDQRMLGPSSNSGIKKVVVAIAAPFFRFAADPVGIAMNPETGRTWRLITDGMTDNWLLETWLTYHSVTFSKTSAISGSGGGTVNWRLCYNGAASYVLSPGEKVASGSRSGDGNVTLTWYDDTESMFVEAYEDASHVGRSYNFTMS